MTSELFIGNNHTFWRKVGQIPSQSIWTFLAETIESIMHHQCNGNDLVCILKPGEVRLWCRDESSCIFPKISNYTKVIFYILWEKSRLNSTFLPYHVKKSHSTLEVDTFKVMLLLSYLASLDNKPRT